LGNPGEIFRADDDDDIVGGRSGDLMRMTTKPEEDDDEAGGRSGDLTPTTIKTQGGLATRRR
jgi:hypothetical protein